MMSNKKEMYLRLTEERKEHQFPEGLTNPSEIENGIFDKSSHIGPWSNWQGNLNTKIILIGQDWGDIKYYKMNKGIDKFIDTNKRIWQLFQEIDIDIGTPEDPRDAEVFFTNAVLGIKTKSMDEAIKNIWINNGKDFLERTIKIIKPQIIITMGKVAYTALTKVFPSLKKNTSLKTLIETNPIPLPNNIKLFVMYHCSPSGDRYKNRSFEQQKLDWKRIREHL